MNDGISGVTQKDNCFIVTVTSDIGVYSMMIIYARDCNLRCR